MTLYSKKLHVLKNGTQYDIDLYDDTQDIINTYPTNKYGKMKVDGKQLYFPINTVLKGLTEGDTPLRIKFNGNIYQVNPHSAHTISVNNPYNITVNVSLRYPDGRTGNITNGGSAIVPYGTSFNASYSVPADYNDGGINVRSGNVTRKTNIQVGDAKVIEYSAWLKDNHDTWVDIPLWVKVLKIKPDRRDAFYIPFYMTQSPQTSVRCRLGRNTEILLWIDNGRGSGDYVHDGKSQPYAEGVRARQDNDNVTLYWSREINKVPESQWKGAVGQRRSGKTGPYYPYGWNFS